jgi:hypothetical protein
MDFELIYVLCSRPCDRHCHAQEATSPPGSANNVRDSVSKAAEFPFKDFPLQFQRVCIIGEDTSGVSIFPFCSWGKFSLVKTALLPRRSSRQVKLSKSLVPRTLVLVDELSFHWSGSRMISNEIYNTGADRRFGRRIQVAD